MSFQIGVEIDNSRIVWILDSKQHNHGTVRLTTVSENQKKAIIKFYIKTSEKKYLLCSENITGIPMMHAGDPSIDIKASAVQRTLDYQIFLNGKPFCSNTLNIRKYSRSFRSLLAVIIVAAVLAAAISAFTLLPAAKPPVSDTVTAKEARSENKTVPVKKTELQTETRSQTEPSPPAPQTEQPAAPRQTVEPTPIPVEPVFIESEITDRYSVYFEPDSSQLTKDAAAELGRFINKLPKQTDFDQGLFKIEVRGHCARYGTEEGRAELSRERAVVVFEFLKSKWGIEADSVISGAGASEPVTLDREEQHLNRRVDINIKGNIKKIETSD